MRRALVLALMLATAGCGGRGGGETAPARYLYFGEDGPDSISATVERRVHADGSEELHGETLLDRATSYMHREVIEDVTLDSDGHLLTADMSIRNRTGATLHEKRIILDAVTGDVSITRPGGHTDWHVATDLPWTYYAMWSDPFWVERTPTPISAWVYARARTGVETARYLAYDAPADLTIAGFPDKTDPAGTWTIFADSFEIDEDFVTSFHSDNLDLDVNRTETPPAAPLEFTVPEGTDTIPFPDCTIPGTTTPFAVASSDGTMIHGVVDLPPSPPASLPWVVLYSGTGGSDRDYFIGGIPRWRCLSARLVAAGSAVVRWDERGQGETPGDTTQVTFTQRSEDATAVARFASTQPGVDPHRLFLFGHSEGVAHASDAAAAVPEVDGLILAGGVASTGREVLKEQVAQILANYVYPADYVSFVMDSYERFLESIENGTHQGDYDDLSLVFWQQFFVFDGSAKAKAAARPVLIAHGGRDWQVNPKQADQLATAFRDAGVTDVTVHVYPADGHYLIEAPPDFPSCGDEQHVPKNWDPAFVSDVIDWIDAHR